MQYCSKCGKPVPEGLLFCLECGGRAVASDGGDGLSGKTDSAGPDRTDITERFNFDGEVTFPVPYPEETADAAPKETVETDPDGKDDLFGELPDLSWLFLTDKDEEKDTAGPGSRNFTDPDRKEEVPGAQEVSGKTPENEIWPGSGSFDFFTGKDDEGTSSYASTAAYDATAGIAAEAEKTAGEAESAFRSPVLPSGRTLAEVEEELMKVLEGIRRTADIKEPAAEDEEPEEEKPELPVTQEEDETEASGCAEGSAGPGMCFTWYTVPEGYTAPESEVIEETAADMAAEDELFVLTEEAAGEEPAETEEDLPGPEEEPAAEEKEPDGTDEFIITAEDLYRGAPEHRDEEEEEDERPRMFRAGKFEVAGPIRAEEKIFDRSGTKNTKKRRLISLIAFLAAAALLAGYIIYDHNSPDKVYARHMKSAETAMAQGDVATAAAEYNKALEIRPDSLQAADMLDTLWHNTVNDAEDLLQEKKFEEAAAAAKGLSSIIPANKEEYAEFMEKIYSQWAYSAAVSGSSQDTDRVIEMAKAELSGDAVSRISEIARKGQAISGHAASFADYSKRILDSYFAGDRSSVFAMMPDLVREIASYKNDGGTFPVISEEERAGKHTAFYYAENDLLQIYVGKMTDDGKRVGTSDSFVTTIQGNNVTGYEFNTCEWNKDAPSGSFTDTRYRDEAREKYYEYSGKLKDGAYDGAVSVTDEDGTVYPTTFENGKAVVIEEVTPGGIRNVIGRSEDGWILAFLDEELQTVFRIPYVQ